jgi:hypothetical protein
MSEQEWLEWRDPGMMLRHLLQGTTSERKLRLFAVACCRRIWHLLRDESSRQAVRLAESYADGLASKEELVHVADNARTAAIMLHGMADDLWSSELLTAAYAADAAMWAATCPVDQADYAWQTARSAGGEPFMASPEPVAQCDLLRDIFGNPFRPVALDPAWQTATVLALAQSIYHKRAFDRQPFLANALEDAGCDNADLLAHCRGLGEHVLGCWAVDLILGKT